MSLPIKISAYSLLAAVIVYLVLVGTFYLSLNDTKAASVPKYIGLIIDDDSPFDHSSMASDVVKGVNLTAKIVVITGSHSGTGREEVKALASSGAHVISLARDVDRAKKSLSGIDNAEVEYVDLLKPDSIDEFAKKSCCPVAPSIFSLIAQASW
ncbi:short subunit dehydrogenase [Pseudomonas sp. SJZ103]|uniref:SDR family NAD(P)-dependent oxidoreductase n=1 Tax=unclassified Pseudomonas TaxID=196821 RepID=UPI0011A5825C|nr:MULTISPECIES: SDR family NAD(P)-dependent oxidoreductase [unclassified Pseudomonas]MBB6290638.1 ABC-type sugar transport system substrate-binding protein [Pseudomonas sp. SJZ073]MBB6315634.1 ABC-type sugar transport system substrate-binding protein [Pseudomonas sp. JAI120]TWC63087.1 short subunit dehydrogenase [Pseudomonas sp. SJZ103]TWC80224.1 short subunit dehydrogenase [Pseudomonas sp. SJZ094]